MCDRETGWVELEFSRGINHSLHALVLLANGEPDVISIEQLSQRVGASRTYLAKLLQALSRAGLVEARRGRNGGYSLARPASSITLWQVVEALQAPSTARASSLPLCDECSLAVACPLPEILVDADMEVRRQLDALTVGGLAKRLAGLGDGDLSHMAPALAGR